MFVSQRWQFRRHSWKDADSSGQFDSSRYEIGPVEQSLARAFVNEHHYSRRMPAAKLYWGLWERGNPLPVGVCVLSIPTSKSVLLRPFPSLEPYSESAELGRLVLLPCVPGNGESFFVAEVFRQAARMGMRGIVSFSDPVERRTSSGQVILPGHSGTIYQALSGIPAGRTKPGTRHLFPDDGTLLSERSMQKVRGQEPRWRGVVDLLVSHGARRPREGEDMTAWLHEAVQRTTVPFWHRGNWRYCFVLGSEGERRALRKEIPLRTFLGVAEGEPLRPLHTYYPKKQPFPGELEA